METQDLQGPVTSETHVDGFKAGELQPTHSRAVAGGDPRPPAPLDVAFTEEEKAVDPILRYFAFAHLPADLQAVSAVYARAAKETLVLCHRIPERTVALRKLLEAKDAAVRSALRQDVG